MAGKNIVTINGRSYDAITGMPVVTPAHSKPAHHGPKQASHKTHHKAFSDISGPSRIKTLSSSSNIPTPKPDPTPVKPTHSEVKAHAVHQKPQKSQTLLRAALKKPSPLRPLTPAPVRVEAGFAEAHQSPAISKFGPAHKSPQHHLAAPVAAKPVHHQQHVQPRMHPVAAKALAQAAPVAVRQPQSSKELKEALIRERLSEATPNHEQHHTKRGRLTRQPRLATILTSSLALLLLAGYLTYINLPNISMRVAATRAGIAANYPNYKPDGYHFAGPITYQPGEVNITFKSNTNERNFVIKQKASGWDSQAVLDNYVIKKTGTYLTYQERGLTIYSFGNKAAWVNGGLLYTVEGNAPLSSDQLLKIATSM
jgi:hypothetical protein